jgi:hypothetical protein
MNEITRLTPVLLLLGAVSANAQDVAAVGDSGEQKRTAIVLTDTPPVLDGVLDDAVWTQVAPIDDFHQFEPVDHAEPSERTLVYLAYDEDNLYVAARMWDSEPDQIRARQLVQGQSARWDDGFSIYLDPFNNKRTGYMFQTNPNGVRTEGTFETPTRLNRNWEDIWYAEARINDEGWVAEMAIPFKTLNFDPDNPDWGFTLERQIARKQESISWSSYNRQVNPGSAGLVSGFAGLQQGRGIDLVPSIVTGGSKDYDTDVSTNDTEPALDVFYNFTPSLTGVLTLNTDFSATEADDQRINLTRFGLFFPEKRDFFLQDVDIFSFGALRRNGMPFNSRRIGLSSSGNPVDMEVGAKVTGRVGRFNVGVLGVQQEGYEDINSSDLFVGRIAANVLRESSVGMIVTDGDPRSNLDNSLVGVDFRYRNSNLPSGATLAAEFWYQMTDTQGVDTEQDAWGIRLSSPNNEGFEGEFGFQHLEENYNPALGFANRTGIDYTQASAGYSYWTSGHRWLRSTSHAFNFRNYDLISGGLQSRSLFVEPIELETNNGDSIGTQLTYDRDVLLEPFEISDGVIIPVGDYEFSRYGFELSGANQRALAPSFEFDTGEFYDGDRMELSLGVDWRPNRRLALGLEYEYNDIELPGGDFVTRLIQINADVAFNARWSWLNLLQYDNESGSAGVNSRLRWNPRAGQDLYIVLNHGFSALGAFRDLESTQSQFSVKYTQTFRF